MVLLTPFRKLSCTQFGNPLSMLTLSAALGKMIWPPLQLMICPTIASATAVGSRMGDPRLLSSCSTGSIKGVRTQLGCMEVVSTFGLL